MDYTIKAVCTRCKCEICNKFPTVIFGLTKEKEMLTKDSLKVCADCIKIKGYRIIEIELGPYSNIVEDNGKKFLEISCPNCQDNGKLIVYRVEIFS